MDYYRIGSFIAKARKEKKLTQKELADILHITDRAVSKWERGKGCPDISLLEDLSKILDVSIIEILKGEQTNKKTKIDNEELIYSMNYVEMSLKEKISSIFNIVSIVIIILISLIILFYNIKIYFYLNQNYYTNIAYSDEDSIDKFSNVENELNIISNDSGNYSTDEYKTIMSYVNDIKNNNDIDSDYKLFIKKNYTYQDIRDFTVKTDTNTNIYIIYFSIEEILKKYDMEINIDTSSYYDNINELKDFVYNYYRYNYVYDFEYNKSNYLRSAIYEKYNIYNTVLQAIINGGNINE